MAKAGRIQHWKHGWIPLDDFARAQLAGKKPSAVLYDESAPFPGLDLRGYDELSPALRGKIDKKLESLTGLPEPELAKRVQANLERMYRSGDVAEADWYPRSGEKIGAMADAINRDFPGTNLTREQLTGMVAVSSAKKRWLENTDYADSVARALAADQPFSVSQDDINDYNAWAAKRKGNLAHPHPELKPGTYRPSDLPSDFEASRDPNVKKLLNTDAVIGAVQIFRGEASLDEVISGPKQRSFVNNLMDPADKRFVTVDTWHYRAAMAGIPVKKTIGPKGHQKTYNYTLEQWTDRDLSTRDGRAKMKGYDGRRDRYAKQNLAATILAADAMAPQTFFQAGPEAKGENYDGKNGVYPWFVKQTQVVADRLGVTPNALQAVAWYTVGGGA